VAATEPDRPAAARSTALLALTAAAMALPGMAPSTAQAQDSENVSLEYHRYEEGSRDLSSSYLFVKPKPLEVDSLSLAAQGTLADRIFFGLDYTQDTWSGATPVTTLPHAAIGAQIQSGASIPTYYATNLKRQPVVPNYSIFNGRTYPRVNDSRLADVIASASPETRREISGKIGYRWDSTTASFGAGISDEPDYKSYFINTDGSLDLNQKLTTVNWGASFTYSDIAASLASNTAADFGAYTDQIRLKGTESYLYGSRHDVSANAGVTQILSKDALVAGEIGYTRSAGYLSNPYKATEFAFDDPHQFIDITQLRTVFIKGVLEERPRLRNQWNFDIRYIQYVADTDAALHFDYRFFHDDWGIDAHTFDVSLYQPLGDGWMIVPGARYYTQSAAYFYKPFFLFNQAFPVKLPRNPEVPAQIDFSKVRIQHYSSDERLAGYGTATIELAIDKQLKENLRVELGADYSYRSGQLKLGGGGVQNFADLHSYTVYATLKFDLAGRTGLEDYRNGAAIGGDGQTQDAAAAPASAIAPVPAGVRFTRLLTERGDFAISLHHDYGIQGGDTLHGTDTVSDARIAKLDCGGQDCTRRVAGAYAHSTTLDILYAPVAGWTLQVSPQLVDLHLDETDLGGGGIILPPHPGLGPGGGTIPPNLFHSSAGLGDTGIYVLKQLFGDDGNRIDAAVGLSLPTGSTDKRVNKSSDYLSYFLQPGSGTVDFAPTLTYRGGTGRFAWGAQLGWVERLESSNDAGYRLGDRVQGSVWGSYRVLDWLTASLRGVGTEQGVIHGRFKPHVTPVQNGYKIVNGQPVPIFKNVVQPQTELGPMDQPGSYGGRFGDIGFGVTATVPSGAFAGNRLSVEWLQPVADDANGYQRARTGALSLTWEAAF